MNASTRRGYELMTIPLPRHLWCEVQRASRLTDTPARKIIAQAVKAYLKARKAGAKP